MRTQNSKLRSQKSEVRNQKSEVGSQIIYPLSSVLILVFVAALIFTGCQRKQKEDVVETLVSGPDLAAISVPPDYVVQAIEELPRTLTDGLGRPIALIQTKKTAHWFIQPSRYLCQLLRHSKQI